MEAGFLEAQRKRSKRIRDLHKYLHKAEFKKNRLIALKRDKGGCRMCSRNANQLHHLDFSKTNHSVDNLICLCHNCHRFVHDYNIKEIKRFAINLDSWYNVI